MEPRLATPDDAPELVRLAALMFETMGLDVEDPVWRANAEAAARARLGEEDVVAFVVDLHATPAGEPLYRSEGFAKPFTPELRRHPGR